jgi:hypothetical protein
MPFKSSTAPGISELISVSQPLSHAEVSGDVGGVSV